MMMISVMIIMIVVMQICGRALRVDHKHDYQVPKEHDDEDELTKQLREHGCAPSLIVQPTGQSFCSQLT